MTSTPFPHDAHPEVTEISAFSEGILPVERQAALRDHLVDCELCAEVYASLAELSETLGTLPGPDRMPDDVACRIDAALAAESLLSTAAEGETGHEADRSDGVVSRETGTSTAPADTVDSADTVSRETATVVPLRPGRRRRTVLLVAAASVAVLTLGGVTLRALSNEAPTEVSSGTAKSATGKQAPDAAPNPSSSTDTDAGGSSDDQQLRKRVQRLLSDGESSSPSHKATDDPAQPSETPSLDTKRSPGSDESTLRDDTLGGGQSVPSCIRGGIHRSETPLAVAPEATFENRTGYLVVLPHQGGDPNLVDAYLVDPSCVSADPSGPGKVLLKRTYPRG
ncbi:hypothetical protein [Streptomyces sp. 891-h]|uniref:hypothetical protein n=1 Tax=Streptomyces sp. 891-h TaxID=2720714 RepID=UPI001FAA3A27|nr:hypothetical protein [Streptomyces sp. 891-h]UNZ18410.1 hypothetical protein HC362_16530 [Streptomyces sp. 891-h]